jgi:predicted phage gp36 major capsid-like protein
MDIASHAPASQEQIYADISTIGSSLDLTKARMDALQQLLADNQKVAGADNEARLRDMESRVQHTRKALDQALGEYRDYLRQLAENHLADTRDRVNNDLAEAHLNIARLQDAAMVRDDQEAGASGKPQP